MYFRRLLGKNVLNTFILDYYDRNRSRLNGQYKTFEDFRDNFSFTADEVKALIEKGESEGVKYNEEQFNISKDEILLALKGLLATNIWQVNEYFRIINSKDKVIESALNVITDKKRYDSLLGQ
jgi:carboxyl-terminal processing protease